MYDFKNKHIMLKLSGEALMGNKEFGIDLQGVRTSQGWKHSASFGKIQR